MESYRFFGRFFANNSKFDDVYKVRALNMVKNVVSTVIKSPRVYILQRGLKHR